ncbi:MAG: PP2C family protein-serine/threonine phosphatase [Spirochaetota bacterium]
MDATCIETTRDVLLSLLKATRSAFLALDRADRILGVMPQTDPLPGLIPEDLLGYTPAIAFKTDFTLVQDGHGAWDELGYYIDASGTRRPFQVRRFEGPDHPYAVLFPGAVRFILATPLSAYTALEGGSGASSALHARELETINQKLRRRARRLKRDMEILEARTNEIIQEMNLAVELQKSLLPKSYPDMDLVGFTHRYIPLAMVGGDFFDIVKLSDDLVGVMISDVSGHGVAPAFITAMLKSSFDYLVSADTGPAQVMTRLNEEFSKIIDTDHYVTAFYAIFDFGTMSCRYCNAGHPPQLLAHTDGSFTEMGPDNPIIGMLDSFGYRDECVPFRNGDILCFYTDGVLEARAADGTLFGMEGIKRSVGKAFNGSLDNMADGMITDLIQYMKDPYFEDDITILLGQVIDSL